MKRRQRWQLSLSIFFLYFFAANIKNNWKAKEPAIETKEAAGDAKEDVKADSEMKTEEDEKPKEPEKPKELEYDAPPAKGKKASDGYVWYWV